MAYNTHAYFIYFLPLVMIAYQLIPKKYRWGVLLVASTVFFTLISKFLILWAVLATLITWCAGIRMETILSRKAENKKEKNANKKKAARVLFFAIFAVAAILLVTTLFYVRHYYRLENGVQQLEEITKKLYGRK